MDDRTVGLVIRALRRRRDWRQADLAAKAGCSQAAISQLERGHLSSSSIGLVRAAFEALEARLVLSPRWRGAELEQLIDEEHARLVAEVMRRLEGAGWLAVAEMTYAEYGERGSIDVVGMNQLRRAVLVVEVKTDIPSEEAVARKVDEKVRLARTIVRKRFGWVPATVGCVLVMPETARLRRRLVASAVLRRMFPADARRVRAWLRDPAEPATFAWFVSNISHRNLRRVRRPNRLAAGGRQPPSEHAPASEPPRLRGDRSASGVQDFPE